jgi:glycine/D-amino acid oxidase-like deaminating enzyme
VGAGIIGLATAYHLASRGRRVVVFERSARASGASVRNFGMLWPIGQPAGPARTQALRSPKIWSGLLREARLRHDPCGSLPSPIATTGEVLGEFAGGTSVGWGRGHLIDDAIFSDEVP